MALYDGFRPTEAAREALRTLIEAVSIERLIALMRCGTLRPAGFRIDVRQAPKLRAWLLQRVFSRAALPDAALGLLADAADPARRAVALLDESVLRDHLAALAAALAPDRLAAALMVDGRPGCRALAAACLKRADGDKETGACARAQAEELLAPLAALLPPPQPAEPGLAPPDSARTPATPHAARRIRALEQRVAAQAQTIETLRHAARDLDADAQRLQGEALERAKQIEHLETERDALHARMRDQVEQQVNRRLDDEAHAWLRIPRAIAQAAADGAAPRAELLERVRAALELQDARDRHSANRAALRRQRTQLAEARLRVRDARREALHPLPALEPLEDELDREITAIDALLDPNVEPQPLISRLAARLNGAATADLPELIEWVRRLHEIGLCAENENALLDTVIARRRGMLAAGTPPDPLPKDADPDDPAVVLRAALLGRAGLALLVDGHNCLFALRARYDEAFVGDTPGARARERLTADLERLVRGHPDLRARLVFDGPERSDRQRLPNLTVTYSGGRGEDRADRVLIEEARFLRRDPGAVVVVSNDNAVAFRARGADARILTPAELETFF